MYDLHVVCFECWGCIGTQHSPTHPHTHPHTHSDKNNPQLLAKKAWVDAQRAQGLPTVPSTIKVPCLFCGDVCCGDACVYMLLGKWSHPNTTTCGAPVLFALQWVACTCSMPAHVPTETLHTEPPHKNGTGGAGVQCVCTVHHARGAGTCGLSR